MNWVPAELFVLQGQDVPVTLEHVFLVLLKQSDEAQFEFLVAADRVCIVLDRVVQLSIFDVHRFHAVAAFFLLKLVIHHFFQTHALVVEQ